MTLIVSFLVAHLTAIIPWVIGGAGVLFGVFRHQQAKTATAKAAATVAKAQASVAQGNAVTALAGQQDASNAAQAQQQAAAIPDANLDAELQKLSALRKD
ncbi:hypothetical protein [Paraburkholderia pallida]|uniref:Uncharacterized protein n=1 Tax=Paraburkholderia pallida TaxID=2547399 RepID=A0A4P7CYF4_9BURK|nr:hypothetical protein [Paraburkholderia pallida]QBQ99264.1 hypothetical protein E1956_18850 [Paraburkholderia pallida]